MSEVLFKRFTGSNALALSHPPQSPSGARAAYEALLRIREILRGSRCAICCSLITDANPRAMMLADLAVCSGQDCKDAVLEIPLTDLEPDTLDDLDE
jgi:hypothetical protein